MRYYIAFLLFSCCCALPARAQRYEVEVLGFGSHNALSARKLTTSGLVLGDESIESEGVTCPFVAELKGKSLRRLCDAGLLGAFDMNDSGMVVGYRGSRDLRIAQAAVWTARGGVRGLGVLKPHHKFSYALAVNNHGTVVGVSGWRERKTWDDDPTYVYYVTHLQGFIWDRRHGMRAINRREGIFAAAINDAGQMLLVANDPTRLLLRHRSGTLRDLGLSPWHIITDPIEARAVSAIGNDGTIVYVHYRWLRSRSTFESFLDDLYFDRADNTLQLATINPLGKISGTFNGVPVIAESVLQNKNLYVNCLSGASVTAEGVVGVSATGAILAFGDVLGDNLPARLILLTPRSPDRYGPIGDFCPHIFAQVQGRCVKRVEEGDTWYDIFDPSIAEECRVKACLLPTDGTCVPNARFALNLSTSYGDDTCPVLSVYGTAPASPRDDGTCCVNIPFRYAPGVHYELQVTDERFHENPGIWSPLRRSFTSLGEYDEPRGAGCANQYALP